MQIFFYLYDDKVLILTNDPCFWATQIPKSDRKERSMGLYVAKMFFRQVDKGFCLYWCLTQKYLN